MMRNLIHLLVLTALTAFAIPLSAQDAITSPTASKTDARAPRTPLFIHKASAVGEASATLEAQSRSRTADFIWEKFDEVSKTYTTIHADIGVSSSAISNMGDGGYRVLRGNDGAYDADTLYGWVIMDYLKIDSIEVLSSCDALVLEVYHSAKVTYSYYDLSKTLEERIYFFSNPKISWTTNPENVHDGLSVDSSWKSAAIHSTVLSTTKISNPAPLAAATYTAAITNDFGNASAAVSTPEIPAIAVYAAMRAEEQRAGGTWAETAALKGSALYKLRFDHSESRNAATYTWVGYDSYDNIQTRDRILWTYTTNDATDKAYVRYSYMGEELDGYIPGRYRNSLIVQNSTTGCSDSIDLKFILGEDNPNPFIVVEPSSFSPESLPNVFTPNGDGINDVFKFIAGSEPVSMRWMNLRIFDRAGKELYKYSGRIDGWEGWNGKLSGTGADCPVGVYYYEISGTGWDNEPYSGKPYRGFVHLFKE